MPTRILLVRHGETAWNRQGLFRGRADVPLNEAGRAQAQALAAAVANLPLAAVYTSPLGRAVETAQAVAAPRGVTVQPMPAFLDIDYGRWQGRAREEIERTDALRYRRWLRAPHTVTFPAGESLAHVRDRAVPALIDLAQRHEGQTILVAAHRVVNKVILCEVLHVGLAGFWRIVQSNACLNVLLYERGLFCVALLNDTCHLEGSGWPALSADF